MGRPFRLVSERRQIARPSYGGEREPDSHPTPGPPTFVQSARVPPPCQGRRRGAARGLSVLRGRFRDVSSPVAPSRPTSPHGAGSRPRPPPPAGSSRRCSPPTPACCTPPSATSDDDDVEVSWAEVAEENAALAHPSMQWPAITGGWEFVHEDDQSPLWDDSPAEGHLPVTVAARLAARARRHTTTPDDCWFGVWDGFGWHVDVRCRPRMPSSLGREYRLLRGPVELAATNLAPEPAEQSANIWWPADHAWCVVTDIDLMSTYVGGSTACIDEPARRTGPGGRPAGCPRPRRHRRGPDQPGAAARLRHRCAGAHDRRPRSSPSSSH